MRASILFLLTVSAGCAQFKTTSTLVLAPTTVTTADGKFVDGLRAADLTLFDNNVPQPLQVEEAFNPLSLIVLLQATSNSSAILDKLGGLGVLFSYVVAGHRGETALITYSDEARLRRDFTADPDKLASALRSVHAQGNGVATLDAIQEAMRQFARRPGENRRVLLVIAEKHDRSSKLKLSEIVQAAERQNVLIYWLTYSPFLSAFTSRPKAGEPPDLPPGSLLSAFTELKHDMQGNAAGELTRATGGRALGFLRKDGLEEAVQAIGGEVHRQYIVSFQPPRGEPGLYHAIRIEVKDRPELVVRTRAGYWSAQ
ncbi:MAG TPA: VWA domain-containing protein [Candidatus Acidoferrales bacterium]|nr:VWA domain-containing protein [Candidatus Acidoferrales bacterium]